MYARSRTVVTACLYALSGWAAFTGILIALGNTLLPPIARPTAPLVVLGLAVLTALAVAAVSVVYFRSTGTDDVLTALVLGTALAAIGLALDALLLLSTHFRYPHLDRSRMGTLAVSLLLGYAVAAVVPVTVASLRSPRSGD
jgi:Kef-type K+ transport system membrane component KefB